jgi:hypothetical protein
MTGRSPLALVPVLTLATCLWAAEAWGRPADSADSADSAASGTRGSRTYQAPVDRAPDVLCGCTEVLKNFA